MTDTQTYPDWIADHEQDAWEAYVEIFGDHWVDADNEDQFRDAYEGYHVSWEDYAYYLVDALGYLDEMPEGLRPYFDYEKFASDLQVDTHEHNGHFFRAC